MRSRLRWGTEFLDFLNIFRVEAIPPQVVAWRHTEFKRGDVVVSTTQRRLYYVLGDGTGDRIWRRRRARGFTWSGVKKVTRKREWPDWTPPAPDAATQARHSASHGRRHRQSAWRPRALSRIERDIASTARTSPIRSAQAVSSGCIRMTNRVSLDLYNRVKIGTKVVVLK